MQFQDSKQLAFSTLDATDDSSYDVFSNLDFPTTWSEHNGAWDSSNWNSARTQNSIATMGTQRESVLTFQTISESRPSAPVSSHESRFQLERLLNPLSSHSH